MRSSEKVLGMLRDPGQPGVPVEVLYGQLSSFAEPAIMPSITDAKMTGIYEDNTTGEPDAVKAARPVRKGIERKGLATIPRSQSTLHLLGQ